MSPSDPVSVRIPEALRIKIRYYRAMRMANPALPEVTVSEVVIIALNQFFAGMETTAEASMNLIDQSFMALVAPPPPEADVNVFDPQLAADAEALEPMLESQPLFDDEQWKDSPPKSRKAKK